MPARAYSQRFVEAATVHVSRQRLVLLRQVSCCFRRFLRVWITVGLDGLNVPKKFQNIHRYDKVGLSRRGYHLGVAVRI
jgi:hypothetical protein